LQDAETRPQQISVQNSHAKAAKAEMQQAAATLEQAELNLRYTAITNLAIRHAQVMQPASPDTARPRVAESVIAGFRRVKYLLDYITSHDILK
jgi:hypothetical protein